MASNNVLELNPVSHVTTGFVGVPGQRTFYLQARQGSTLVSLLLEKEQVAALAQSVLQLIEHLDEKYPSVSTAPMTRDMNLEEPIQPLFRVGQMGLGYDQERDLLVLVAQEIQTVEEEEEVSIEETETEGAVVRMWANRGQMEALARHALEIVKQGRPVCPLCHQPMNVEGHFCPPRNGHKHATLV
jgi:uncharacterized repeat protein (TIGR03847 family)